MITFYNVQTKDPFHFQLILTKTDDLQQQPYTNISGAAISSNKTGGFFEVNTTQYTSHYKANCALFIFPIQAHFNLNKYWTKKLIPFNNTYYVSLDGLLKGIETDAIGHATLFQMFVDNINFFSKAALSPSITGAIGKQKGIFFPKFLVIHLL